MSFRLFLATLLTSFSLPVTATPPTDVVGWNGLRWGATPEEVVEYLGRFPDFTSAGYGEPDWTGYIGESSSDYLGYRFDAVFSFDNGALDAVIMMKSQEAADFQEWKRNVFARLSETYGPPHSVDAFPTQESPNPELSTWQFPTTDIRFGLSFEWKMDNDYAWTLELEPAQRHDLPKGAQQDAESTR